MTDRINETLFLQVALGDVGQVQKVERDIKQNIFLHVSILMSRPEKIKFTILLRRFCKIMKCQLFSCAICTIPTF